MKNIDNNKSFENIKHNKEYGPLCAMLKRAFTEQNPEENMDKKGSQNCEK